MGKGNDGISFPHLCQRPNRLGGQETSPSTPIYNGEAHGSSTPSPGASVPPVTHLPPRLGLAKPCQDHATSTTTPSCCWISINFSPPLAGSRRRRRPRSVRVLNAEVTSVRRSVIGGLDHDEYDSINRVHLNASARDLQGYVDALLPSRC